MPDISTGPQGQGVTQTLINWMKSIFGSGFTLSRGYSSSHDGVDLPASLGTPVYALKAGVISYAKNAANDSRAGSAWAIGGGNVVNIDIGGGFTTQYAHLNTIDVKEGQVVKAGDKIGTVGKTGFTIGRPHLHFGLWDRNINKMINPSSFFNSLGDTTKVTFADTLKSLGISTDPTHVITRPEAEKIAKQYNVTGSVYNSLVEFFTGKTVSQAAQGGMSSGLDGVDLDVGGAIAGLGNQISDTVTWIGFVFAGIAVLLVGAILIGGRGNDA